MFTFSYDFKRALQETGLGQHQNASFGKTGSCEGEEEKEEGIRGERKQTK